MLSSFVFIRPSTRLLEEARPAIVGVGVAERGGLGLLENGETAREVFLDCGRERSVFDSCESTEPKNLISFKCGKAVPWEARFEADVSDFLPRLV